MACATLKRSWEFDPVHSPGRPSKRPRCSPMCTSPTSSSPPPAKKSAFDGHKMTPDEMAASLRYQIERLKRRPYADGADNIHMNMSPSHSEGSNSDSDGMPMSPDPQNSDGKHRRKNLFTFKQPCFGPKRSRIKYPQGNMANTNTGTKIPFLNPRVPSISYDELPKVLRNVQRICARVVKEREEQIRQEYDEILNSKLHEQYDTFIRFSRDQIQRHFSPESTPSYLS